MIFICVFAPVKTERYMFVGPIVLKVVINGVRKGRMGISPSGLI